jgi:hypothetical protein
MKWYGSITNRLQENKNNLGRDIMVGDDITKYLWSDRTCYYVTKVEEQKHITIRQYEVIADRDKPGGMGHQNWLYFKTRKEANDYLNKYGLGERETWEHQEIELVYRYGKWREKYTDRDGKVQYRGNWNISFGIRDFYNDWEF